MKKYLFLLFLFLIYIILNIGKEEETKEVILNDYSYNNIIKMNIKFNTGINSKKLFNQFEEYANEYLINNILVNNVSYEVKCSKLNTCYEDIYGLNDIYFYNKYISAGFVINSISIISNKEDIIYFLELNNYNYTIDFV